VPLLLPGERAAQKAMLVCCLALLPPRGLAAGVCLARLRRGQQWLPGGLLLLPRLPLPLPRQRRRLAWP
jgi:hypothetical protein